MPARPLGRPLGEAEQGVYHRGNAGPIAQRPWFKHGRNTEGLGLDGAIGGLTGLAYAGVGLSRARSSNWAISRTLHRASVGQGPRPPRPSRALAFWYWRALVTGTARASLCLTHHHATGKFPLFKMF